MDHTDGTTSHLNDINTETEEELVNKLNIEEVRRLTPLLMYLCLIIVIGLIGNGLVCYIYKPAQITSSPRWFIFFLGALDLFSCAVIVPCELATIFFQLNFENAIFCKFSSFFNVGSTLAMIWTLIIVSIDRYRKVCKPNDWQLDLRRARITCIISAIAAFVMALPALAGRDIHHKLNKTYNVTVSVCTFRNSGVSDYKYWYVMIGMVLFLVSLVAICIMYCFVGCTIYQRSRSKNRQKETIHMQDRKPGSQHKQESDKLMTPETSASPLNNFPEPEVVVEISSPNQSNDSNETTEQSLNKLSTSNSGDDRLSKTKTKRERSMSTKVRSARARKATLSLFFVSVAFVLCYLPNLSLLLARGTQKNFEESLTNTQRSVYMLFLRSHLLNCAINPFIYFVSDSHFQNQCKCISRRLFGNCFRSG